VVAKGQKQGHVQTKGVVWEGRLSSFLSVGGSKRGEKIQPYRASDFIEKTRKRSLAWVIFREDNEWEEEPDSSGGKIIREGLEKEEAPYLQEYAGVEEYQGIPREISEATKNFPKKKKCWELKNRGIP